MTKEQIIKITEEWLNNFNDNKKRIKLIDTALKLDTYDKATIEKLKQRRHKLHKRLSKIIEVIGTLTNDEQKIICYRYFDKLSYKDIGKRLNCRSETACRRNKKLLLVIGRAMFGFEDEFLNEIYDDGFTVSI